MKLNKNKIIVSALGLVIGASLAGSVSGTIAWYQYSTRANVSFIGQASGFSGNLQMRFANNDDASNSWRTRITWQEMKAELERTHFADKIIPMTYGQMGRDEALPQAGAYVQPKYGLKNMASWGKASNKHYAQFELQLRYNERDGVKEGEAQAEKDEKNVEKKVYLSKLVLQQDGLNEEKGKSDLSSALRVHISSSYKEMEGEGENAHLGDVQSKNKLISKDGGAVLTEGKLDLNNDGKDDQAYPDGDEFGFSYQRSDNTLVLDDSGNAKRSELADVIYGEGAQISYAAKSTYVAADKNNTYLPYGKTAEADKVDAPIYPALAGETNGVLSDLEFDHDLDGDGEGATAKLDKFIGKTIQSETEYLSVKVTIWVEGWQKLLQGKDGQNNDIYSAIWDEVKYIDSGFNIGLQFAVEDAALQSRIIYKQII